MNMKCPSCGHTKSKVIDSRPADEGASIRRRRECINCQKRFTTYEIVETVPINVIKKDGSREVFNRNKILNSIIRACDKRQVTRNQMERIVSEIELQTQNSLQSEIQSSKIGELVMEKLKEVDEVAYVRFASVYRQFQDVSAFMDMLNQLLESRK